ncbi:MAG: TIGR02444 family protein [Rhizobiaceae bacterium]|nr:TIGR02444 family protein [Rhizobiaceae bacterium]
MTAATDDDTFPLWTFSLDRYGRDGVAETCLWLQQRLGADVNIVLASLYAGDQGKGLSKVELRAIVEGGPGEWHREVVVPLRQARVFTKSQVSGADAGSIATFRSEVKQMELAAEKWEQRLIERHLDGVAAGASDEAPSAIALENLAQYLSLVGTVFEGEVAERARDLVHACVS